MALGSFPNYTGVFDGMDLSTGKRNIFNTTFKKGAPDFSGYLAQTPAPATQPTTYRTDNATGDILDVAKAIQRFEEARYPFEINKYKTMSDIAAEQQLKQAYQLYPLLSQAGAEKTERDLEASTRFLIRKEQMPSNVGQLMALKQAQATSAAAGEADRARAVAAQQDAAKNYAGRFAGQYIQVG